jgi:hypothetical protein
MSGATDLVGLVASMAPELAEAEMVFCSLPHAAVDNKLLLLSVGFFREREGIALIISRADAESHGMPFHTVLKAITLTVHSSLEAVGFTAAIAGRLARHGISANVVAAYHHDHVFIPVQDAERALQILLGMQAEASAGGDAGAVLSEE